MDTIGQLRYLIRFAVPLTGRDSAYGGNQITKYVQSQEIFAGREYAQVGSDEKESAAQLSPVTRVLFTIRGRKGIDTSMQIVYESRIHRITAVLPTQRTDFLKIETEQIGDWQDQALVQSDGQSLIDAEGNALIMVPGGHGSEGYEPPGIKLYDAEGNLYTRS